MGVSDLFRGAAFLTAAGLCSQTLGFFYRIALSRLIGAEYLGLFQLLMPLYSLLLSLTAVGFNSAVSTLTAHRLALGDRVGVKTVTDRCISYFLLLAGGVGCLLALGSDFVSTALLGDARTQLGLILLAPCLLLTGVENLQKHFFYGTGSVRLPALVDLAEQVIRVGAVLGLLLRFLPRNGERTLGLIVCGMVICEVFSAAAMTVLFRRATRDVHIRSEAGLGRQIAGIACPIAATALLNNLLSSADAVLIPRLLIQGGDSAEKAMGQYGVLFGMTIPLLSLPTALIGSLNLVLTPELARLLARGQTAGARQTLERSRRAASLVLLPLLAWLCAVGPELGTLLFREASVGRFLLPLAVGTALNCHQAILCCTLNASRLQQTGALIWLVSDAVQLLFTLSLVPRFGLGGYVLGYLVSSLLALLLCRPAAARALGGAAPGMWSSLAPVPAAVLTGLCVHTLFHALLARSLPLPAALGVCALFGGGFCLLCLWVCGLVGRRSHHRFSRR